ncbi:multicopper oxidase family protein [Xanthobacter oligotrophicus]|uniref:multicopper oxidase family protein n=1 Tax=Xanthobacter oligotrophicus TaxID=2607286 RepID=UPI0011F17071|nr:multicopper oxidase family protein [Xanthobacter oligotrophicus]MCG5237516.1 multicopper oxidase family protein [Xanthobacter oligotrophicus]
MTTPIPSRRTVLKGAAALSLSGAAGALVPALAQSPAAAPAAVPPAPQASPPVTLTAAEGSLPELAGPGPLALFNGALPGPVLRVKKGGMLNVTLANSLKENVALTWQGVRLPAGSPALAAVAPGKSASLSLAPTDAGTFWYHATSPSLARRALAGPLVVEEAGAPAYAADHLLFIQSFPPESGMPIFPVNGAISPTFQGPATGRARLRLVNATPLFLRLKIRGPASYAIAVDGQPVSEPFELKDGRIQIAPGGRVDVAATLDDADATIIEIETTQDPIRLAVVTPVGAAGTPPAGAPAPLPPNDLPAEIPLKDALRIELPIGDKPGAGAASLGTVKAGKSVVLTLVNSLDAPVSVYIAGHPVRLLDNVYDGWRPWWHDTVPVPSKATVRVAFRAAVPGTWSIVGQRGGDGEVVVSKTYEVTA